MTSGNKDLLTPGAVRIWLQRPEHRLEFISLRTQTDSGQDLGSRHQHAELTPLRWQGASPALFLDIPISISQKKEKVKCKVSEFTILTSAYCLTHEHQELVTLRSNLIQGVGGHYPWKRVQSVYPLVENGCASLILRNLLSPLSHIWARIDF